MKKTSIILAAAALVAAMALAGCKLSEDEEDAISGEDITYKNASTTNYYRSFKATATKHYSADPVITINNPATIATSSNDANAVYGILFGLEETTPTGYTGTSKFYNFGIASVRWNQTTEKAEWYVSWCKEVPDAAFNATTSSGFSATVDGTLYGTETQIIPTSGTFESVTGTALSSNKLSVMIKITANDSTAAGSYTVKLCDSTGSSTYSTANIPSSTTGFTTRTQRKIGRYFCVYGGEEASASIKYTNVQGAAIVVEDMEEL